MIIAKVIIGTIVSLVLTGLLSLFVSLFVVKMQKWIGLTDEEIKDMPPIDWTNHNNL